MKNVNFKVFLAVLISLMLVVGVGLAQQSEDTPSGDGDRVQQQNRAKKQNKAQKQSANKGEEKGEQQVREGKRSRNRLRTGEGEGAGMGDGQGKMEKKQNKAQSKSEKKAKKQAGNAYRDKTPRTSHSVQQPMRTVRPVSRETGTPGTI